MCAMFTSIKVSKGKETNCIVLYCIVLYCIVLYCIVFFVLYCIVLYCIVLYRIVLSCDIFDRIGECDSSFVIGLPSLYLTVLSLMV